MSTITKKLAAAVFAVSMAASGLFAQFLVTDFNDGTDQNNIGFYYYYFYTEEVTGMRNEPISFPSGRRIGEGDMVGTTGLRQADPVIFAPMTGGVSVGGVSTFGGGFTLTDMPAEIEAPGPVPGRLLDAQNQAYPLWGFGVQLTANDTTGFNAQHAGRTSGFQNVESVQFDIKLTGELAQFEFKIETTAMAPGACGATCAAIDDPWFKDPPVATSTNGRPTHYNSYRVILRPGTPIPAHLTDYVTVVGPTSEGFYRYTIKITPVVAPTGSTTEKCGNPTTATDPAGPGNCPGSGWAGALRQEPYFGTLWEFKPEDATKLAWVIKSQNNVTAQGSGSHSMIVDNIYLNGANFTFTPYGVCQGCINATLNAAATGNQIVANFDDDVYIGTEELEHGWDNRMNMLGEYWYFYVSDGVAPEEGIEPDVEDPSLDVIALGTGNNGSGLFFAWDATLATPGENEQPFAGIGTNFFKSTRAGDPVGEITGFDATDFEGIYFEFKAPADVPFITVVISDDIDFSRTDPKYQGVRFSISVPNENPGVWTRAIAPFNQMVQPQWLITNEEDDRRDAMRPFSQFNKAKLAQIQFRYDGTVSTDFAIDNVVLYGTGGVTPIRHVTSRAQNIGMRAAYNRGVVNVNWTAPVSIQSGKMSLINARGRTVSSAPITAVNANRVTANLGSGAAIPSGMYFVRIDARDVNGKRIVQQAPIRIVR